MDWAWCLSIILSSELNVSSLTPDQRLSWEVYTNFLIHSKSVEKFGWWIWKSKLKSPTCFYLTQRSIASSYSMWSEAKHSARKKSTNFSEYAYRPEYISLGKNSSLVNRDLFCWNCAPVSPVCVKRDSIIHPFGTRCWAGCRCNVVGL